MELVQRLISTGMYNIKCPYEMTAEGICIHNTANDASALNEIAYMQSNYNEVSFHIAVDDKVAIQGIPFNRNCWASGDGGSGRGNRKHIHIEICYSLNGGERFIQAEKNCAKLVAKMLKERGWGIDKVKKHQDFDFTKKYCPHRTLDLGWGRFLNMIQAELNGITVSNAPTPQPTPQPVSDGQYLFLKAHVTKWNVYPTNVAPVTGNQCGTLAPSQFGGIEYKILANPQRDVYTIETQSFGRVNIYAPKDNDSEFRNKNATVVPQPKPALSNSEYTIKEYAENGRFTCTVAAINFRNKPYVGSDNPVVDRYTNRESVNYDRVVVTNKYTWISWISASTGTRRYMPITDKATGEKWGYCI